MLKIASVLPFLFLGQTTPSYVTPGMKFLWNPVTTDVNGKPDQITGYEIAVVPPLKSANTSPWLKLLTVPIEAHTGYPALEVLKNLVDGVYGFQCRAIDKAGLHGDWSEPPLPLTVDTAPPGVPAGFRVTIEVFVPR